MQFSQTFTSVSITYVNTEKYFIKEIIAINVCYIIYINIKLIKHFIYLLLQRKIYQVSKENDFYIELINQSLPPEQLDNANGKRFC